MSAIHIHKDNKRIVEDLMKEIGFKTPGEAVNALIRRYGEVMLKRSPVDPVFSASVDQRTLVNLEPVFQLPQSNGSSISKAASEAMSELDDLLSS